MSEVLDSSELNARICLHDAEPTLPSDPEPITLPNTHTILYSEGWLYVYVSTPESSPSYSVYTFSESETKRRVFVDPGNQIWCSLNNELMSLGYPEQS